MFPFLREEDDYYRLHHHHEKGLQTQDLQLFSLFCFSLSLSPQNIFLSQETKVRKTKEGASRSFKMITSMMILKRGKELRCNFHAISLPSRECVSLLRHFKTPIGKQSMQTSKKDIPRFAFLLSLFSQNLFLCVKVACLSPANNFFLCQHLSASRLA